VVYLAVNCALATSFRTYSNGETSHFKPAIGTARDDSKIEHFKALW
jgi:hypothetical protein